MNSLKRTRFVAILLTIAIGFIATARAQNSDELQAAIASALPGFGGMFERDGQLHVYLVTANQQGLEQQALVESAIEGALGATHRYRGKVIIVQGQYDFLQLAAWRSLADNELLGILNVHMSDIDEMRNQVTLVVDSEADRLAVTQRAAELGIPEAALNVEVGARVQEEVLLTDVVRPLVNGLQIWRRTGGSFLTLCSLGYNGMLDENPVSITNAHCTPVNGGIDYSAFYQGPTSLTIFDPRTLLGYEIADPAFFTEKPCIEPYRCRYSDAALLNRTASASVGYVAITVDWSNLNISHYAPIVARRQTPLVAGMQVFKTGRTTGTTWGNIFAVCAHVLASGTDMVRLCQDRAMRATGETRPLSQGGDSGSPVFIESTEIPGGVVAVGIHWGGTDGVSATFSPISQVRDELGPVDICHPDTPCP